MSRRPPREDDARFADVLGDVRPLAGRGKVLAPPLPKPRPRARGPSPKRRQFIRDEAGSGRADDVALAVLAKLGAGEPPPEREVDLHGFDARAARTRLERALLLAERAGERCVLVIHGHGQRSGSGVLREALPDWLMEEPIAARLRAFAAAPRRLGGAGATLVLLRRLRGPAVSSASRNARKDRDPR